MKNVYPNEISVPKWNMYEPKNAYLNKKCAVKSVYQNRQRIP